MKKLALGLSLLFLSPMSSWAETFEYKVDGMTCGSCVKIIKAKVCSLEGVETCDVAIGSLKVKTKEGSTLGNQQITEAVSKAGDYTLTPVAAKPAK
ncbi:MAG: heavy-metal-associated domain-containing protein [Bdellovibrionia bacterium]